MPNTKITDLTSLTAATGDEIPVNRSGSDGKITAGAIVNITGSTAYQPLDSDLTSWAGVTRASGFDSFAATPSSANLITLVTDETGSGALVFGTSPTFTTSILMASDASVDIGTSTVGINDLHIGGTGGVINFDGGDVTITHSANALDIDGGVVDFGSTPTVNSSAILTAATGQPLDADLTSWAGVTRASGFDTFTATPSSANLASLVTGETGSGALVFGTSPTFTTDIRFADDDGIADDSGNEQLWFQKTASATNYIEIINAATGGNPRITARGSDTDVKLSLGCQTSGSSSGVMTLMPGPATGQDCVGINGDSTILEGLDVHLQSNNTGNSWCIVGATWSANATPSDLALIKSRNASVGGHTIVQNGDLTGQVITYGSDGTDFEPTTSVRSAVDGVAANNDMPGRLELMTTPAGSTALVQRMVIKNDGGVIVGINGTSPGTGNMSFADGKGIIFDTEAVLNDASLLNLRIRNFGITIDGGGAEITTGHKGFIVVPYACTITGWTVVADQTGAIVIDVDKSDYASFPTQSSIAGSEKPTLSGPAQKNQDLSLSTWTTSVAAGDVIGFEVESVTDCERVHLSIHAAAT